jgi:regulatory protein YycH of two-component signal transduction system YycFG
MLKTTNKKGFKINVVNLFEDYNTDLKIETKLDNKEFEELGTLINTKGFVVTKIKKKKWTTIQLKFSSTIPFGIYEATLESYIGSYVKRS